MSNHLAPPSLETETGEMSPEQQARETLEETVQTAIRSMAEHGIAETIKDTLTLMKDKEQAAELYKPLDRKIEENNKKIAEVSEKIAQERTKNIEQNKIYSAKYGRLEAKKRYQVRKGIKYGKARNLITTNIANRSSKEWGRDPSRQTAGRRKVLSDFTEIEEEIKHRVHIRELIDNPNTSDEERGRYQTEVDSWANKTDDEYRSERRRDAEHEFKLWLKTILAEETDLRNKAQEIADKVDRLKTMIGSTTDHEKQVGLQKDYKRARKEYDKISETHEKVLKQLNSAKPSVSTDNI